MLRSRARFKHFPIWTSFRPATIPYLLNENNRRKLPLGPLDSGVCGAVASNHDRRPVSFHSVEANGDTVVHRKADSGAISGEPTIGDAWKGLGEIDVASWEI